MARVHWCPQLRRHKEEEEELEEEPEEEAEELHLCSRDPHLASGEEKQGHARCNGPAVFGCFARRPKSRFEDPYSTLCFFHYSLCHTVFLRLLTSDHVLFNHGCISLPTFQVGSDILT